MSGMELSLKFAPQADVRRFNAARFDPGLPPFGASFRQPGRSFHEVVSDDEEDEEQMALREKEDREKDLLKAKGGPRAPDEWRMKGMREDASDVSWIIEDSASTVGYSGKMLTQKKAQYVVMVARKQSKEVLVMPVERWFKFDRQTKKKSAERRLQEQRARTNFKGEGAAAAAAPPKAKPSLMDRLGEVLKKEAESMGAGAAKAADDDGGGGEGGSDADDGMEFDAANSDDEADGRIGAMGKRESESDGEGAAGPGADPEGKGRLGRKFKEEEDQSDDDLEEERPTGQDLNDSDGGASSDGEAGRSYGKIDSNTWGSGSDMSGEELANVDIDDDDVIDEAVAAAGKAKAVRPSSTEPKANTGVAAAGGTKRARESPPPESGAGKKRARDSPSPDGSAPSSKKQSLTLKKPTAAKLAVPSLKLEKPKVKAASPP